MRFITEFEVPESAQSHMERRDYIPQKRHLSELKMGNMVAESFGWQNPVNHNLEHHRLEIEAFPMDKWVEFKSKLREYLDSVNNSGFGTMNIIMIDRLFRELESFSKKENNEK